MYIRTNLAAREMVNGLDGGRFTKKLFNRGLPEGARRPTYSLSLSSGYPIPSCDHRQSLAPSHLYHGVLLYTLQQCVYTAACVALFSPLHPWRMMYIHLSFACCASIFFLFIIRVLLLCVCVCVYISNRFLLTLLQAVLLISCSISRRFRRVLFYRLVASRRSDFKRQRRQPKRAKKNRRIEEEKR